MRPGALLLACGCLALAQDLTEAEQRSLSEALAEAGSSPVEFVRALENHLARYPASPKRAEIERALVKAAIESKDERRIVLYGERLLGREQDDMQVLERVARALLSGEDKAQAERALKYAQRYGELISRLRTEDVPGRIGKAQWLEELDRGVARSFSLQARATGNLGKLEQAAALARNSFEAYPTAEGAREAARWLMRLGKEEEALRWIADAFTVSDPKNSEPERLRDRQRIGELYKKRKGSEQGLGDLILASYDRVSATLAHRKELWSAADPNAKAANIFDFTLSANSGQPLKLSTLRGKAVVFDFWATWCGPCRAQHPLYEQVKQKFRLNPNVVFLSVNTDEDRSGVDSFLEANKWSMQVYFEDGLSQNLQIYSIPTTLVLNRRGEITSRMNGYLPERFVDMLSERIEEALK